MNMGAMKNQGQRIENRGGQEKVQEKTKLTKDQVDDLFRRALLGEKLTGTEKSELETALKGRLKENKKALWTISVENGKIFAAVYRAHANSRNALQTFLREAGEDGCLYRSGIQPALSDMARFEVWESFKDDVALRDTLQNCPMRVWDQFAKHLSKKRADGFADISTALTGLSRKLSELRSNPDRSNDQIKSRFHAAIQRFFPEFDPNPDRGPERDDIWSKIERACQALIDLSDDVKEDTSLSKAQATDLVGLLTLAQIEIDLLGSFVKARFGDWQINPDDGAVRFTNQISEKQKEFNIDKVRGRAKAA